MSILDWIDANVGVLVHLSPWTWPIAETLHFFGLCLLFGAVLVIDLRLLGYHRVIPTRSTHELLRLVFIGFGINVATGMVFFAGNPHRYAVNIAFWLKMICVLLAGLNALYYRSKLAPLVGDWTENTVVPGNAKVVGALSLVLWLGVLSYGRLIPYMGTG